jgi:hypothetical protein
MLLMSRYLSSRTSPDPGGDSGSHLDTAERRAEFRKDQQRGVNAPQTYHGPANRPSVEGEAPRPSDNKYPPAAQPVDPMREPPIDGRDPAPIVGNFHEVQRSARALGQRLPGPKIIPDPSMAQDLTGHGRRDPAGAAREGIAGQSWRSLSMAPSLTAWRQSGPRPRLKYGGATFARLKMLLENIQIDKEISNTTVKVFKELRSRGDGA